MSLIYFDINDDYGTSVIWEIKKEYSFYSDLVDCEIPPQIRKGSPRELEWIVSRFLAKEVDNIEPSLIEKDECGKPYVNNSTKQISISHSRNYASYASSLSSIGIDIQVNNAKIERISQKFTTEEELNNLPDDLNSKQKLHYIWTIKEAVFKLYGKKELPFKEGIMISSSNYVNNELITKGLIVKLNETYEFKTKSIIFSSFYFTIARFLK